MDTSLTSSHANSAVLETGEIAVPDFTGQPLLKALDESDKLGLTPLSEGSGKVIGQYPPPGSHVRQGTPVHLQLSPR